MVSLGFVACTVRVGRGDTAGQHVLYVAYELTTFSDFMARHNSHLVDMGETDRHTERETDRHTERERAVALF